jgi:outer membrane lipoprotein SlyB
LIRFLTTLTLLVPVGLTLNGCGPSYSPDTYATNAAQQANKVEAGVIAGFRPVHISAQGTVGGVAGAAAGGVAGSQVGTGTTSAFAAIGGSLIGGIAGVATEHVIGDTDGFEYIVRKANGDMVSVAQKDPKPLNVGQKVLVISGPQARIIPDYTVPFEAPPKVAVKPATPPAGDTATATHAPATPPAADAHPPATDAATAHSANTETPPSLPPENVVPRSGNRPPRLRQSSRPRKYRQCSRRPRPCRRPPNPRSPPATAAPSVPPCSPPGPGRKSTDPGPRRHSGTRPDPSRSRDVADGR